MNLHYTHTTKNILNNKQYFKLYLKYITIFHINNTVNKKTDRKYQQQKIAKDNNIQSINKHLQNNIIQSTLKK